jgi:hypothetical protein
MNYIEQSSSWAGESHSAIRSHLNFSPIIEQEGSLAPSEHLTTDPYPDPDATSQHLPTLLP